MRGSDERNEALFSYVNLEDRVPARHPLRLIREIVNAALASITVAFLISNALGALRPDALVSMLTMR